jgi:hypothetical protein
MEKNMNLSQYSQQVVKGIQRVLKRGIDVVMGMMGKGSIHLISIPAKRELNTITIRINLWLTTVLTACRGSGRTVKEVDGRALRGCLPCFGVSQRAEASRCVSRVRGCFEA